MKYRFTTLLSLAAFTSGYAQDDVSKIEEIPLHAIVSSSTTAPRTVKAKKIISVYSQMTTGNLVCIAGDAIILRPGFKVINGAQFHAKIQDVDGEKEVNELTKLSNQETTFDPKVLGVTTFPNPFIKQMEIQYWLPERSKMSLSIYNDSGILVARPVDEVVQKRGLHKINFEPGQLSPGMYTCVLNTPTSRKVHKIVKQ